MVSSSFLQGKLLRSVLHLFYQAMHPNRDRRYQGTSKHLKEQIIKSLALKGPGYDFKKVLFHQWPKGSSNKMN